MRRAAHRVLLGSAWLLMAVGITGSVVTGTYHWVMTSLALGAGLLLLHLFVCQRPKSPGFWTAAAFLALTLQFYGAKWATETEEDPQLAETVQFGPELYPQVAARITPERLTAHIEAMSSIPSRISGTAGCERAAQYVLEQFQAFGEPRVEEFPVTVPVRNRAELETGGSTYPLYPLYPNGVCPAAVPEEGLETKLVYAGLGRLADVEGMDLEGATVVVETGAREQWLYLIDLGAEAIVFVERERPARALEVFTQTLSHQNVPRFWMNRSSAGPLLDQLKAGGPADAVIRSDADWEQRAAKNIWVDIPGVSEAAHNRTELVVLEAYYDASSFVPGLAPGAEQACGLAALFELGRVIHEFPFQKNVRLLATAGHFQALEGARRYVWEHVGKHESPLRDVSPQDHAAFFALDLSSSSERLGLFFGGHFFMQDPNNLKPRLSDLGQRATEYADGIAKALGAPPEMVFVDTVNPAAGKDWPNFMPAPLALDHEPALLAGIPALAFVTANDSRFYTGTPNDTEVNIDNLTLQVRLLACLLPNAFNVEGRYLKRSLPRSICTVKGRAVYFDPGENYLPDKAIPHDVLVMARRPADASPFRTNVLSRLVTTADENGEFEMAGLAASGEVGLPMCTLSFEPYVVERGRITWAPNFGEWGKVSYPTTITPVQKEMELVCVAFECETLEIYNLFDPRNYNYLSNLEVLEADSNSVPHVYGTTLNEAGWPSYLAPTATIFALPGARLKIAASAGPGQKRMVLLNVPGALPSGKRFNTGDGFAVNDVDAIHCTYYQAARDMWRLDESRVDFFARHGIANARVDRLHDLAGGALLAAESALEAHDYRAHFNEARRALSLESRAYPDVAGTANDTVRGLLFYLALLLPFAFTMERLFLPGRRIETRILGVILFFTLMFVALRLTHPAFQIVHSPMVVLLGFVISVLSIVVISIVTGKLETLVSKRKTEQMGEHESSVKGVSGLVLALEMGIANMRRRGMRTLLTSITLIVLTFSVLSFASVTERIRLQRYRYDEGSTPYKGALLRTKNWTPFPFETYASLRNELDDTCTLAARRWYYGHLALNQSSIDIQSGDRIRTIRAVIGLTANETEFLDVRSALLGDSRWLSPDQPGEEPLQELLAPLSLALELNPDDRRGSESGLTEAEKAAAANAVLGQKLRLLGREFEVVGVYDSARMNALTDIDGEPLTPYDPIAMEKKNQEEGVPDPDEVQRYVHHSFQNVVIVSERLLGSLGGEVRSLALKPHDPANVEQLAESLVRRMDYILFVNLDGEPTLMSSRNATSVSELWNLAILMAIAGLIVFNTMLGSVYERTGEIGTYTALGIAPSHIGRLFLVEAAVFAVIGVMAGYVFGQSVSWLVHTAHVPLLNALNLNYSSLAGVGACVLVIAMTMASAYYPSRKATQIGVPDIERRWRLPVTREPRLSLELPFTVSKTEAQGLVAFLHEYFESHVDVSVGSFYVEDIEAGPAVAQDGHEGAATGIAGRFWLTPFDLGVSQRTVIVLQEIEDMDVCGVQVLLERLSGDAASWRRANGHFMADIRGQFLIWRNLSPEVRSQYVLRGKDAALA